MIRPILWLAGPRSTQKLLRHQKLIDQIEKELEELELRGTKFAREYGACGLPFSPVLGSSV